MRLALVLLTGCIPLQTSTTTSTHQAPPSGASSAAGSSAAGSSAPAASSAPAPAVAPAPASPTSAMWFVSYASVSPGPQIAVPVTEGTWLDANGKPVVDMNGNPWNHAMRTTAATLATIKWGRPIIVGCGGSWYLTATMEIDQAAGTINIGNDRDAVCPKAIPVANARVIVEFKDVR